MKKIYYNKLIRDRVAEKMEEQGKTFEVKKLNQKSFERALIDKVEEEAGGILNTKTRKDLMEELADLLAVVDEIKRVKNIKPRELRATRRANMKRKGGFSKQILLVWAEDDGYRTNEKRNKKKN